MKTKILILLLASASAVFGQSNVNVVNPAVAPNPNKAGPVNVILRDTAGAYVPAGGDTTIALGGAAHLANSQVATSTTAATLFIARATRVGCLVRNLDTTISVYIGKTTVTAGNGMVLKAGESVVLSTQELVQVIAASGTPTVAIADEYN